MWLPADKASEKLPTSSKPTRWVAVQGFKHLIMFSFSLISSHPNIVLSVQTAWTAKTPTPTSPVRWQTTTGARWQNPTGRTSAAVVVSVRSLVMKNSSPWDTAKESCTPRGATQETIPQQWSTSYLTADPQLGWRHPEEHHTQVSRKDFFKMARIIFYIVQCLLQFAFQIKRKNPRLLHSNSPYQHVRAVWLLARPQSQPVLRQPATRLVGQGQFPPSALCRGSAQRAGIQAGAAAVAVKPVSRARAKCDQKKGAPGFEPGTSWSAVKCSTTELYPLMNVWLLGVCLPCCHSLTHVYFRALPSFPAMFAYQLPAGRVHTGVNVCYICMRGKKKRDDERRTKIGKGQRSDWKFRTNSTMKWTICVPPLHWPFAYDCVWQRSCRESKRET